MRMWCKFRRCRAFIANYGRTRKPSNGRKWMKWIRFQWIDKSFVYISSMGRTNQLATGRFFFISYFQIFMGKWFLRDRKVKFLFAIWAHKKSGRNGTIGYKICSMNSISVSIGIPISFRSLLLFAFLNDSKSIVINIES